MSNNIVFSLQDANDMYKIIRVSIVFYLEKILMSDAVLLLNCDVKDEHVILDQSLDQQNFLKCHHQKRHPKKLIPESRERKRTKIVILKNNFENNILFN